MESSEGPATGGLQIPAQLPIVGYIADFACGEALLVIELDGSQHLDAADHDAVRTRRIQTNGDRVLRFWNDDVLSRIDSVLEEILRHLPEKSP